MDYRLWNVCHLDMNPIKSIKSTIMNIDSLVELKIDCYISPLIRNYLKRNMSKKYSIDSYRYKNLQRMNDINMVKSIKQSIYSIVPEAKRFYLDETLEEIIADKDLDKKTKERIVDFCQDKSVHSFVNLTFDEVLCSVWHVITENKQSSEIKKVLNNNLNDVLCRSLTGRLSKLVNCLNGFDSKLQPIDKKLSTDVHVLSTIDEKIKNNYHVLNAMIEIKNNYDNAFDIENDVSDLSIIEKRKEEIMKQMLEKGYDTNVIKQYIIYLE
jgi:hypothetical protein